MPTSSVWSSTVTLPPPGRVGSPIVIGHRGAAGYRPEHTLASYELAARLGVDYIEPDLVSTADGVLVARHEPEIGATTDVAEHPEFADRKLTKTIDGRQYRGWFVEDFTLAELRTLRARERMPEMRADNTRFDGRYPVPTFTEVLTLADQLSDQLGRIIGVYPETMHPSYFASIGLPLERPLVAALRTAGMNRPDAPVYVQSFEVSTLRRLADQVEVPLVQLIGSTGAPADRAATGDRCTYAGLCTPDGLAEVAEYADAIGPDKHLVIGVDGAVTSLLVDAHAEGLAVHAHAFRNENRYLPADLRSCADPAAHGDALGELVRFLRAGVDGVFCDHPDTAVAARRATHPRAA